MNTVRIDGHYDAKAGIAWLRFEDYDPQVVVAEETDFGLRELDRSDRHVVGLEYWHASERLPATCSRCSPRHRSAWPAEAAAHIRDSRSAGPDHGRRVNVIERSEIPSESEAVFFARVPTG